MDAILIHYHELALKGENRPYFLGVLIDNIKIATKGLGVKNIQKPRGRIILELDENASYQAGIGRLAKLPGIANIMPVWIVEKNFEKLKQEILEEIKSRNFKTFRITARRADKSFSLTSQEINEKLGDCIDSKVDLKNPELEIFVEILEKQILFGFEKIQGIGGLPVSASGKAVCLLSGGIDSPVASQMMLKRGLRLIFAHFHSFPYLNSSSQEKAKELAKILNQYQYNSKLYLIPFGDIQKEIKLKVPAFYLVIMYRRLMFKIAEEIAKKENAKAVITGENLGQVASQTLENISVIEKAVDLPIFRPLLGLNKEEIINKAKELGTYEISIKPDQDCCSLFVPEHPETKGKISQIEKIESELDTKFLVSNTLKNAKIICYNQKDNG